MRPQMRLEEMSMLVHYYPPHIPQDPAMALEDSLRRAYPFPTTPPSDRLDGLLRHLMEQARRAGDRLR